MTINIEEGVEDIVEDIIEDIIEDVGRSLLSQELY
jgi:hypothetical protein